MGSTAAATTASGSGTFDLLRRVVGRFDVGELVDAEELTAGLMNRNWRVQTSAGFFALKQVLDISPEEARRQHRIIRALAADEFPVPAPLPDRDRYTLVDTDDGHFMLLPWVDGDHRRGRDMTLDSCRTLGELLARVHVWLEANVDVLGLEPSPAAQEMSGPTPEAAAKTIGRFLDLAASRSAPDEFDQAVKAHLAERQELLDRNAHLWPGTCEVSPVGWTHGDFHALNVIWAPGATSQVAGVLDWDRLRSQPLAWELARSATLLFGYDQGDGARVLDLDRVAAFTSGYRKVNPLADEQVAECVHLLWWSRLCDDFWQLERRYDQADTSADHLFLSASSLLTWWTAHRSEVTAACIRQRQSR